MKMIDFMILMKRKYHQSIMKSLQQQGSSKTQKFEFTKEIYHQSQK